MCQSGGGKGVSLDVQLGGKVKCFGITVLMTFDMVD